MRFETTFSVDGIKITKHATTDGTGFPYVCMRCDTPYLRPQRKCGACGAYSTVVPVMMTDEQRAERERTLGLTRAISENRIPTGVDWLDSVLGGGIPE